ELHALVGRDCPAEGDGGLRRQRADGLVYVARGLVLPEHRLREAASVAEDHELHALLVAQRVHPRAHGDALADVLAKLRDQCAAPRGATIRGHASNLSNTAPRVRAYARAALAPRTTPSAHRDG